MRAIELGLSSGQALGCVDDILLGNCEHDHHKDMSAAVMITAATLMMSWVLPSTSGK